MRTNQGHPADDLEAVRTSLTRLGAELLRADADESMRRLVHEAQELLKPAPFYVVACGEYGRGKSTLLSALAGRRQLFPHEPNDTTGIATTLAWGQDAEATVTFGGDATAIRQVTVPLEAVRQYVIQPTAVGGGQCVLIVEMTAPLDSLRSGLVLVDTPGVNSRNEAHNVATRQYLSRADAILFVASVDEPLSTLELAVLGQAAEQCPQIVAVLTKVDMADQNRAAELAASASERASKELGRLVDVLPVSAVMALDARDDDIEWLEVKSQIPSLRRRLGDLQNAHGARATLAAAPLLVRAIRLLAEPYLRELAMLREAADQAQALERKQAQVQDQVERDIEALDDAAASFRRGLARKVSRGLDDIRADVTRSCGDVTARVRADQRLPEPPMEPDAYLRSILNAVADIANRADARREELIARIVEEARPLTDAKLARSAEADSLLSALPQPTSGVSFPRRPGLSFSAVNAGLFAGVKIAAVTGSVGGLIGTMVVPGAGSAAGAGIGALLGHMAGWVGGTRDAIRQAQQEWRTNNRNALADIAIEWVGQATHDMDEWIGDATSATTADLRAGFDDAVSERRARLTSLLQSAAPGLADTAESREARIEEATRHIARYEQLSRELTDSVGRLERLAGVATPPTGLA